MKLKDVVSNVLWMFWHILNKSILVHSLLDHILILTLFSVHVWSGSSIGLVIRCNFQRISFYICTLVVTYGSWPHTLFILPERGVVGYNIGIAFTILKIVREIPLLRQEMKVFIGNVLWMF